MPTAILYGIESEIEMRKLTKLFMIVAVISALFCQTVWADASVSIRTIDVDNGQYELSYSGPAEAAGKRFNVYFIKGALSEAKKDPSAFWETQTIEDDNIIAAKEGITADSSGSFSVILGISEANIVFDSVPYITSEDDSLLPSGSSPYLVDQQIAGIRQDPSPAVPTMKVSAGKQKYNDAKISWSAASDAEGYQIYRKTGKSGSYKNIKTIKGSAAGTYYDGSLLTGTQYYYKMRSFAAGKDGTVYSKWSSEKSLKPALAKPKIKSVKAGKKKLTVKWAKVKGASGYVIYRSAKKSGGFRKVKTIKKGKTVSFKNTKLKSKKTYYYKIRAYRTVKGKKVYSAYSAVKGKKVK